MNKNRIEELVSQAHQNLCSAGKEAEFNYNFADEFAKLIIEECMKVVDEQIKDLMENIGINPKICAPNSYEHGYLCCGVDSYVAIRQHFYPIEE
jgi:hypothetical protein